MGYGLWAMRYALWAMRYGLKAIGYWLLATPKLGTHGESQQHVAQSP